MPPTDTASTDERTWTQSLSSFLALFTSTGTLLCCALPSALAALAGGSAVASLVSAVPWLVPLSQNKEWIFLGAGVMILLSGILVYRPKGKVACTIAGGEGCAIASRFTMTMFWLSVTIYGVGVFFAYALLPLQRILGS